MSDLSDQEFVDRLTLQGWSIQLTCLPGGTVSAFGFWSGAHFDARNEPSIRHALTDLFEQGQAHIAMKEMFQNKKRQADAESYRNDLPETGDE